MSKEFAIGIDLGSTFSSIAVYIDGSTEIIPDKHGNRLIPSVVFFDPQFGKPCVGRTAIDLGVKHPENCLKGAKRLLGRSFDDEFIMKSCQLNTSGCILTRRNHDSTVFQINIGGKKVIKTPEEVTANILVYLKQMASEYLGKKIKEVVVAIPAHFSIAQRRATKKAVDLAGLCLLKFVSETAAGAAHYVRDVNETSKILVFDWGGGKLDVSAIQLRDKIFDVKAVVGDTLLGGTDIDERLYKHFYRYLSKRLKYRLIESCVILKEQLSFSSNFAVTINCFDGANDYNLEMSRSVLENMIEDKFLRAIDMTELCLDDAGWHKYSVDDVVLVGGCTRIPIIREHLQTMFPGVRFRSDFNPDEAVAAGACLEAFWYNNPTNSECKIIDVTPLSLGLEYHGNLVSFFINKNTPLPKEISKSICTSENNQKNITFKVFEGERKNCLYNNKVGEFNIEKLPSRRVGELYFTVTFTVDQNGLLTIRAFRKAGETESLGVMMGELRINGNKQFSSIKEAHALRYEDDLFEEFVVVKDLLRRKCQRVIYYLDQITLECDTVFVRESCQQFLEYSAKSSLTLDDLKYKFGLLNAIILPILERDNLLEITEYHENQ